ncbi:LLM class flavin-dependent oxidoreductase [Pseudonocardia cypriaca]|uniref:Alkanesulfonate monooxygenase SsuD/methylene tetrahydromethanopterin reductase-like flavin-dependent oxidoreductase (Luciferase family) n=1 Tax=Pseudonocardia cypriaca TaxID=882449 RepID=A0A543GJ19_9PSEU|nr:LLM class flavin-dependent oxidoreductase [Pseudonocardia cypriaca]TQM46073.1 alkanesulfonate monooxygenase SsuD/methylene tetrahydromethanopterin reductase-like flavin-dependent oxidoreductase (luciferase family) [Pseudonocardia cypriaca]
MTVYGHPLLFGSFLTPTAADPEHVVGLAQRCERLGLDLVTVQDHPYQPRFLDTWTLLSYVAARTRTVRLAANVTNLPLRPPAVLARSVASLDLLSGGRVELGLGAGAFWEAIEAMGGRRLPGGQGVRALEEAIDVIRQVWDVDARGGVRVEGEFHRVVGAKRGPAPAHDVGIWLGAYKPRMLALTGRVADGWLPSLGYLQPGDLAAGNAIIDDAAREAGRSPRDIRRLLNVGPAQSADELAGLALDHGISTFILAADDPGELQRFAEEVAPAVRELVSAEGAPPAQAPVAPTGGFTVVPTPDDGVRRSATRVWDESERPTGPAPDPHRTYAQHELAAAQHLVDVHDHLRSELARVRDLVDQVVAGAVDAGTARSHISTMTLRQNNWTVGTYCESYCRVLTMHHTLEDQAMFPRLRRGDPRLAPVVDRLQQEHQAIHTVLELVDRALVAFVAGHDTHALHAAVDLLTDTLLSHLAYEERELVEPIARLGIG